MKKVLKSKIFWVIVVIIVIIIAFVIRAVRQGEEVEYITQAVKRGDIVQTVSATGQIKSASEIELNFKNAGKLSILNVKVGQKVEANEILAQLRATDLSINVTKARADLSEAQANLDKLKAGATNEDIAVYKAAVDKAETDLMNTAATYSQALTNEQGSILTDVNSALTKANIALQEIYDTIYYEGNENNFTTYNSTLHLRVKDQYLLSLDRVDQAELAYNMAVLDLGDDKINDAVNKTLGALVAVSSDLDDLAELFDYVNITSVLTQAELDILKTNINTERTTINTSNSTIQTAKQDLADAHLNYQTQVETAKDNLAKAKVDLALREAPARPEDITLYEAKVRRALAELQLTQDKYDETIIRSPIVGIVTDINFNIGEQTNLAESVITMLAEENYEIEVDIPESDIVKIDMGDAVEITLDAFTSEDIFEGIITTINPAQTEIQDVIYYSVTVTFGEEQPNNVLSLVNKIKPGMTANVTVNTDMVDNIIIIPLRAVKEQNGKKMVEVLENEEPKSVEVTLGLKGDEGLVEVISGLVEGQEVITFVREK